MKKVQRLLSVLLVCCMVVGMLPLTAYALEFGGSENNITWRSVDGIMTFSGTGPMVDYASLSQNADSFGYRRGYFRNNTKSIAVTGDITRIGDFAFAGYSQITSVTITDSLTSIGKNAFYNCVLLKSISIPAGVNSIGSSAFEGCTNLVDIIYGGTEAEWIAAIGTSTNVVPAGTTVHFGGTINSTPFAGGDGTAVDPYQIASVRELDAMRNYPSAHFVLVNDIDLLGFYTGVWEPIGSQTEPYTGTLDGAGYSIKNMNLVQGTYFERDVAMMTEARCVGLFGYISHANIKNLNIEIASCDAVVGCAYVYLGGLAGYATESEIDSIRVSGQILKASPGSAGWAYHGGEVGGIVGRADKTTITNSHNSCDTTIDSNLYEAYAGGITGFGGEISFSSNSGNIGTNGDKSYSGGISGAGAIVRESYNLGNITAAKADRYSSTYAGGILGNAGNAIDCYNIGRIGDATYSGGIYGKDTTVTSCYSIADLEKNGTSGIEYFISGVSTAPTEEDMKNQSSFAGFDFDAIWTMGNTKEYPYPELKNNRYTTSNPEIDGFSISLDKLSIRFTKLGASEILTATVQPIGKEVSWRTSDESVVVVDDGVVTAVGYGTATITASISDGDNVCYAECIASVLTSVDADVYIIEQVKKYTTDTLWAQSNNILLSQEPDEVKMQRWQELFTLYGFTDANEGIKYLSETTPERRAYIALTTDDMYAAYQTWNYLNNTPSGILSKQLLQVDGLVFNGEISAYIDPLTLFDLSNLPDVKKYKDVLYEFMDAQSLEVELVDYISWVNKLSQNADKTAKIFADILIDKINKCTSSDELYSLMNEAATKDIMLKLGYDNSKPGWNLEYQLDESTGFGKFHKAMGYAGQFLSAYNLTVDTMIDFMELDSKLAVYATYKDFLTDVVYTKDFPLGMRGAAAHILNEIDSGVWGRLLELANDIIEQTGIGGVIKESGLTKILGENGYGTFNEVLLYLNIGSWAINQVFDISSIVKGSASAEAYAILSEHYKAKLESNKLAFQANQSVENAWEFFENYNILWTLRKKGEEAALKAFSFKANETGVIGMMLNDGYVTLNATKEEYVADILEMLEGCKFILPSDIKIPESVQYVSKTVISCPVNVEVYAPDETYITTLYDGMESDLTNDYGRFAVVYRAYTGDYAKIICLSATGNYKFRIIGTDDGLVDFEMAAIEEGAVESYTFNNIATSKNAVFEISMEQISDNQVFDIDLDGDGIVDKSEEIAKKSVNSHIAVTNLALDTTKIELDEGESFLLTVMVKPENATRKNVIWATDNEDVASVTNGKVVANSAGTAKIYCVSQDNSNIVASCIVTAQRKTTVADGYYLITFDANGGAANTATMTTGEDGKLSNLPIPTRDGYTFGGWYTAPADGEQITTETFFSENATVYAHWTENIKPPESATFTITFNANGGTIDPTSMAAGEDGTLSTLPTPVRTNYTFDGWYTAIAGGTKITTDTVFSDDSTIYAHWSWAGGGFGGGYTPTTNPITVPIPDGGIVTVSPTAASNGGVVTITIVPNDGYELSSLVVTDKSGKEIAVTNIGGERFTFTMPNSQVSVNAVFQKNRAVWNNPFTDVAEGAWYYDAVKFANENSLMNGVGNSLFAPNANLSRAMIAQILYNKEGTPGVNNTRVFADVASGVWYTDAVAWAAEKGIVDGYGNGLFGPDDDITREELAVMLWRYAGEPAATDKELHFSDADKASGYALEALYWAVENGIINGKGGGILDPTGQATRAETAQMLKNFLEK